ncbi:MAG: flagellar basal body rod C-terminal domain-containing protein [Vulcanimicrobiaceae bacterium]|jgi:flagellar basal body rod protein FlgC
MSEFDILAAGASGMERQRTLLELSARNVAAAQASTPGHEYHRLVADFEDDVEEPHVRESSEPVDALTEMISMLDAQRSYEANASIFDVGKRIAERAIDLDRP